ncbi:hypothetical protein V8D89_008515 [Ganoderma adspersum]
MSDTVIIDGSPASYIFHPDNPVPVFSWVNDPHDTADEPVPIPHRLRPGGRCLRRA